ncbi:hypothetical protein G9A89_016760 [Geosiphon pyriformis]|nr:hypothetical protein G9A89_016760 [Geosiphon pyriformis]
MTAVPVSFKTYREGPSSSIITQGWSITSTKLPILNSREIERAQAELSMPLPEMFFGNNTLTISNETGFKYKFSPMDALKSMGSSKEGCSKVELAYAEEWNKKSTINSQYHKDIIKPYDWTYTTDYKGTLISNLGWADRIDLEKLRQPEPISFYDENILFEDELADNGIAILLVKIRVMPSGFFVLQRYFLRVDDVLFRSNETRLYHEFGTAHMIREYSSREAAYNIIRALIPQYKGDDISQLIDPDWVSPKLLVLREQKSEKISIFPVIRQRENIWDISGSAVNTTPLLSKQVQSRDND